MDTHDCRHLLGSLSEYVDGALDETLCAEIDRHLHECKNCRVVVDSLRKTVELYQTTKEPAAVPPDVRERLFRRLNLEEFMRS
ncbi:MAG TPA: anti-sigma factor [Anaerolineales bacterium]|nr:anti-sigma factor [Anaerolineales bacterium]